MLDGTHPESVAEHAMWTRGAAGVRRRPTAPRRIPAVDGRGAAQQDVDGGVPAVCHGALAAAAASFVGHHPF